MPAVPRADLIERLHARLAALPFIHAAWLEGADAAGRADLYSDIDLWLDVDGPNVEPAFEAIRTVLQAFGPLDLDQARPHPDPQLRQRFYRSAKLSKFWVVDVVVQLHGREVAFGPHDPFHVLFDRAGVIRVADVGPLSSAELAQAVSALNARRWRWMLVEKEVRRGQALEALAYYHAEVLEPLVELLRLRHGPGKREYGLKHVYADLPAEAVTRLEDLYGRTQTDDLLAGVHQASDWFDVLLTELRV